MTAGDSDIGPELQLLAAKILATLDPIIQAAADAATSTERAPGKCQQVWCPVCAIAAVASGEQHPLVTIVAEHGAELMALLRATGNGQQPATPGEGAENSSPNPGRYEHIDVTFVE